MINKLLTLIILTGLICCTSAPKQGNTGSPLAEEVKSGKGWGFLLARHNLPLSRQAGFRRNEGRSLKIIH